MVLELVLPAQVLVWEFRLVLEIGEEERLGDCVVSDNADLRVSGLHAYLLSRD